VGNFQEWLRMCVGLSRPSSGRYDLKKKTLYNVVSKNKKFLFKFTLKMWESITPHPVHVRIVLYRLLLIIIIITTKTAETRNTTTRRLKDEEGEEVIRLSTSAAAAAAGALGVMDDRHKSHKS